jgi:tRNA A37 threonylcarbamoyladenosine biosynthesis protein TsaE
MVEILRFSNLALNDLQVAAAKVRASLPMRAVIFLQGTLGAGKTTLVQAIVQELQRHHLKNKSPSNNSSEKNISEKNFLENSNFETNNLKSSDLDTNVEVQSPSFALHNYYSLNPEIHHFDLYRLQSLDEVHNTGFFDLLSQNQGWVFVEWPELLSLQDMLIFAPLYKITLQESSQNSQNRDLQLFKLL